jgi:hypothetical protein
VLVVTGVESERMAILETKVQHLSDQLEDTHRKVDEMHSLLLQAKGARWVIIGMAAVGGAIASFATKLIPVTHVLPR